MASRHGQLVDATIAYLFALGHYAWPVPNRGVKITDKRGRDRWIRGKVKAGVADVIAAHAHGRGIACEIKITPDTLSPARLRVAEDHINRAASALFALEQGDVPTDMPGVPRMIKHQAEIDAASAAALLGVECVQ